MIFELESGKLYKQDELHELIIAGSSDVDPMHSGHDAHMYYDTTQTRIMFFDGYIRAFVDDMEVTGNFYRLWFVDPMDSPQTSTIIAHRKPIGLFHATGTVAIGTLDPSSMNFMNVNVKEYNVSALEGIRSLTKQLAKIHNINLPEEIELNLKFNELLMLYSFPLLRNYYTKEMSLNNLKNIADLTANGRINWIRSNNDFKSIVSEEADDLDFLRCRNLKEATDLCLNGIKSKKIFKHINDRIITTKRRKIQYSEKIFSDTGNNINTLMQIEDDNMQKLGFKKHSNDVYTKTELNLELFLFVRFISKYLTIDHIQTVLEDYILPERAITGGLFRIGPDLMTSYSKARLTKLFSNGFEREQVLDAHTQYKKYKNVKDIPNQLKTKYPNGIVLPKKPKTWKEVHDVVSKVYNEIKAAEKDVPFEYTEQEWVLHGYKKKDVEFKLASSGATVVGWGKDMKHCIASLVDKNTKSCILVGVHVHGKLLYNIQISKNEFGKKTKILSYKLVQHKAYDNKSVEDEHLKTITDMVMTTFPPIHATA